jgi:hypothetical protein
MASNKSKLYATRYVTIMSYNRQPLSNNWERRAQVLPFLRKSFAHFFGGHFGVRQTSLTSSVTSLFSGTGGERVIGRVEVIARAYLLIDWAVAPFTPAG